MDIERYQRLKSRVDNLRRDVDRAEAGLAVQMERLKTEFDCSTREEAETKIEEMEDELQATEKRFEAAMAKFEKQWGDRL